MYSGFLKSGSKKLEALRRVILRFHRVDSNRLGTVVNKRYKIVIAFSRFFFKGTNVIMND
jgi:hypothetical protein